MRRRLLAGVAGVFSGVLPVAACPACWPAYASVLSSLGITFFGFGTGHFALVGILLSFALGMLAYDWKRHHHRLGPLMIGLFGCACILASNTFATQPLVSYVGSASFLLAAFWNGVIVRIQRKHTEYKEQHCACCKEDK